MRREIIADFHTPLSVYCIVADEPYTFLLESVEGGENFGRYSIVGLRASTRISIHGKRVTVTEDHQSTDLGEVDDPLTWIDDHVRFAIREPDPDLPRFIGGWVGYFGYDCVRAIEPRLSDDPREEPLNVPDIYLLRTDTLVIFDNLKGSVSVVVRYGDEAGASDVAEREVDRLESKLKQLSARRSDRPVEATKSALRYSFAQDDFESAVTKIKDYIRNGDVMQVVLAQRISRAFNGDAIDLYRAIRYLNPSPYLFLFNFSDFHVVGASPEILVRRSNRKIEVRPIAGTRPRGQSTQDDAALANELLADTKERAEHLMLIDLGRNDLGRLAHVGSVKVSEQMVIEKYSHVMHMVSHVEAELDSDRTPIEILRATFPAGTLSGAPKVRALELIREFEPERRGIYGGAVGYISDDGNFDLAITIRSAICCDQHVHVSAGAGIVYDSDPRKEWEETLNKGRAMLKACELIDNGFRLDIATNEERKPR